MKTNTIRGICLFSLCLTVSFVMGMYKQQQITLLDLAKTNRYFTEYASQGTAEDNLIYQLEPILEDDEDDTNNEQYNNNPYYQSSQVVTMLFNLPDLFKDFRK